MSRVIYIFSRNIHDPTLPLSIQVLLISRFHHLAASPVLRSLSRCCSDGFGAVDTEPGRPYLPRARPRRKGCVAVVPQSTQFDPELRWSGAQGARCWFASCSRWSTSLTRSRSTSPSASTRSQSVLALPIVTSTVRGRDCIVVCSVPREVSGQQGARRDLAPVCQVNHLPCHVAFIQSWCQFRFVDCWQDGRRLPRGGHSRDQAADVHHDLWPENGHLVHPQLEPVSASFAFNVSRFALLLPMLTCVSAARGCVLCSASAQKRPAGLDEEEIAHVVS